MKCTFCGYKFQEKDADKACKGCPLTKNCSRIKCPNCGFEVVLEPEWFKKIRRKTSGKGEK